MPDTLAATAPPRIEGLPPGRRVMAMSTVVLAVGMATLDNAIANTALPSIAVDVNATAAASVWVINAYQLATVAAMLPLAALGDILGHKRIYLLGVVVFTLASLGCALAWSLPSLAVARILQGLGGAGIMSVNTALIRYIYPPKLLGRGYGLNALVVAVSFAIGPTIASAILSLGPWPWLFAVNVPLGIVSIVLALTALPATHQSGHRFDIVLALLNAATFGMLILAIGEAAHEAPLARVVPEFAVVAVCGAALLWRQRGSPAPMFPVDLFRFPMFSLSAATSVCSFAAQGLAFVSLPFYFEQTLGRSQVETGFLMTPWPVVVGIMAPVAGRLVERYSPGLLGGIGMAILCAGMALTALLPDHPTVFDICWRLAICGAGFGFFQSPNLKALMSAAPPGRSGGASGIVGTARLLGQATGAALVALCFGLSLARGPELALALGACFAGAAAVASFSRMVVPAPAHS